MTLVLKKGILIPMQPIEGEITGAMFEGEGTASLTPPTQMDAWFLKKGYGSDKFSENFSKMYMRFTDGTEKTLPKSAPGSATIAVTPQLDSIIRTFRDRQEMADDWLGNFFDMDMDFLDTRIGGITGMNYFYAQFLTEKWGWVTFRSNYGDVVEVTLGHDRTVGMFKDYLPWANFHKQADYRDRHYAATVSSDSKEIIDIIRSDLKVSIPTTKTVEVDAQITLKPLVQSLASLRFELVNQVGNVSWRDQARPVRVEAVTDANGNALPFLHKRNELLVRPPRPLQNGEEFVVRVKAKEDTIEQITAESYQLYNTYPWFPQYAFPYGRAAFDFTIEIQKPLVPVGSGHIVREWEDKERKMNGSELRMDDQVQFPSMLFGRFMHEKDTYQSATGGRAVTITVNAFPTMTSFITDPNVLAFFGTRTPFSYTLTVPQGKMKGILEESKNIIKFYEVLYGPFTYGDLQVAQMYPASGFGQSPPSLVQLDGLAFASQAELESDFLHEFLSHEIAHQYWGNCVGEANERDVWLAESFAEYSAGMYVQALMGEKRFHQKWSNWKKNAQQADAAAPVALATSLSGETAPKYYTQLVYNKGPLIVHMIRTQLGNDAYSKTMTGLMAKYRNQNITTETLSRELSAATGYNWDYFFDQWYWGVGIPEIHYKYSVTPQAGKYLFELTLRQKDAENFKKILKLPVTWKGSSKEQLAEKDFMFAQQGQVYKLMLPFEPKEVELDPNYTLLADFVQDK